MLLCFQNGGSHCNRRLRCDRTATCLSWGLLLLVDWLRSSRRAGQRSGVSCFTITALSWESEWRPVWLQSNTREELTPQASTPHSHAHCVWLCVVVPRCTYACLLLCTKRSEVTWQVMVSTHSDSWVKACSTTTLRLWNPMENVNDIEEGLHDKYCGVSVHRKACGATFLCDQGLSSSSASSLSSSASLQLTGESN